MQTIDISGQSFGRWKVLGRAGSTERGQAVFSCVCECGTSRAVVGKELRSGRSKSCGCLFREEVSRRRYVHGQTRTAEYRAWSAMKNRCLSKKELYKHWGGRGIEVCERWLASFECFLEDMGKRPSSKHSLERVDVDKGYCKENCKWATQKEQQRNKTNTVRLNIDGDVLTLPEASARFGIKEATIYARVRRYGWSEQRAVLKKVRVQKRTT